MARLCVGLCWAEGDLVAVMPLAVRRHRGLRVLEWAAKDCSDYCDALVDPGSAASSRALEQVWAAVAADGGFDLAYLSHVRPDAALHQLIATHSAARPLKPGRRSAVSRQVEACGTDGRAWFDGLDGATRDGHARGMDVLNGMGPVTSRMFGPADATDEVLGQMIDLKRRWLDNTGQSAVILDDDARTLRALAKELAHQHALRVFSLYCGDVLVAALLNIAAGARMQVFLIAYDLRFAPALPEALVMIEFIIEALDTGTTQVDLLCVDDDSAFTFTNARVDLASYVAGGTLLGRLALAVGERLGRTP